MNNLQQNLTGDSLSYLMGLRWTPQIRSRWVPYAQILAGGNKLTQELMLPKLKAALSSASALADHDQYTRQFEADSFTYAAGTGMDLNLNRALAVRLVNLEYTRSWVRELNGFKAPNGLQIKAGIVLRMGTW